MSPRAFHGFTEVGSLVEHYALRPLIHRRVGDLGAQTSQLLLERADIAMTQSYIMGELRALF